MVRYVKTWDALDGDRQGVASIRMTWCFFFLTRRQVGSTGSTSTRVGRLVESVSGQTHDAYFRDKIFAPLGMKTAALSPRGRAAGAQAA